MNGSENRKANAIDDYVGSRVKLRRRTLGLSQQALADEIGVTFQQLQKYEGGANRISASRLYRLAQALDIPLNWFFEQPEGTSPDAATSSGTIDDAVAYTEEALRAANSLMRIKDANIRWQIVKTIEALSEKPNGPA